MLESRGSSGGRSTFEMAKYLIEQGADVNYRREGYSVSYLAGLKGRAKTAEYIVANGGSRADVEKGSREANLNAAIFLKGLELGV